jgi:hypothetical protein
MEIENLFRYAALAVGLKPSANQGKARLRGLWRIMYSKTISPRLTRAKPACAGYGGLCIQRPYTLGYARRRSPARARADYVFKDHTPSAMRGDARLRGRERIICSKTISPPEAFSYGLLSIGYSSAPRQALLSVIGYRLSAIGYGMRSPPARNANSNDDPLASRLSPLTSRLSCNAISMTHCCSAYRPAAL